MNKKDNYLLFGVCSRLGDFLNVDPTVLRIVFVLSGSIFLYLFLAYLLNKKENNM